MICATPLHAEVLAALHALAFAPAEQWSAASFVSELVQPGVFGFSHDDAGLVLARVAADEAEILTIAVAPVARRSGIGTLLLRAAEAHAMSQGAIRMFLEVDPRNRIARSLYAKCGYTDIGRRRRYYADGADACVMARLLAPPAAPDGSQV